MVNFFPDSKTFLNIFNLSIKWYAVLILTGAAFAFLFSRKHIKEIKHIDLDFFDNLFIYTLWFGIIGARLWFCIFFNFKFYFTNPIEIIKMWDGGLAIQGGLVAGFIFALYYCKKHKVNPVLVFDSILPNVLLAQAFGRWGNFVNQECHGGEVDPSYFDGVLSFLKEGMYINGHYYEPLFFYESMLCLIGWAIIIFILRKYQNKRGDLTFAYLMWYGVVRFFIEYRRTDSLYIGNLKMAMVTSVFFMIIGLLGYFNVFNKYFKKKKPTIIFDIDGTLVDTTASIIEAYKEVYRTYGKIEDFTPEIQVEVLGPALKEIFGKYFPDIEYDTIYKTYRTRQDEVKKEFNKVTPNSEMVLKTLHEEGYNIGIVSSRTTEGVKGLLDDMNLSEYVDDIVGVWDVKNVKPDPEAIFTIIKRNGWNPDDVVMIGDSSADVLCGLNYGAYSIGYLFNPDKSSKVVAAGGNRNITDMAELLDILKENHYFTYNLR